MEAGVRPAGRWGMRVIPSLVSIVVAWAASSSSAHADEWYGYQTLSADAAAIGAVTEFERNEAVALVGLLTYFVGAPLVHAAHGEVERAGWSLGARVFVPLVFAGIGANLLPEESDIGGALGAFLGIVATIIADSALASVDDGADVGAPRDVMLMLGGGF